MANTDLDTTEPEMLGRYVVQGTLGEGGMGTVLEAFDPKLDRRVAIKVLHREVDDRHTTRLLREAQAMARLSHPNVVQVYEAGEVGGRTFVAMELIVGQTLRQWMRKEARPSWRDCVEVFVQAGEGLAAAHEQGLIHRDFKPGNAMIDDKGRVRVLDFGLARQVDLASLEADTETDGIALGSERRPSLEALDAHARTEAHSSDRSPPTIASLDDPGGSDTSSSPRVTTTPALRTPLTRTGAVLGTPAYMSLEQLRGGEVDARSDQFSFCVALWEAVYGERPFPDTSLMMLSMMMAKGDLSPPPKDTKVPPALHSIMRRGLAPDPAQRWPSMATLVTQLRRLVAPRHRRGLVVGLGLGLAGMGVAIAMPHYLAMQERCTGARTRLAGVWDDTRREAVRGSILATELSYAPSTWERVERQLDEYAGAWARQYTELCEANIVRGELSPAAMDLGMECLRERSVHLRATLDELEQADATAVENAVQAVSSLPKPSHCADADALAAEVPPPEDPAVAERVAAVTERVVVAQAKGHAGRYDEALSTIRSVVTDAETLDYGPLRVRAWLVEGWLRERTGDYEGAASVYQQGYVEALAAGMLDEAAEASAWLVYVVGRQLARHQEARRWAIHAEPLSRASQDPSRRPHYLTNMGNVALSQGEHDEARELHEHALTLRREALGPRHPAVADSMGSLGIIARAQGKNDQARELYEAALAIFEQTLGAEHPKVAATLGNLGNVASAQGKLDEAVDFYERALVLWQAAVGPRHPEVATVLDNLGGTMASQGNYTDARGYHERALTLWKDALGPRHPAVARSLGNLAVVAGLQGKHREARGFLEQVVELYEASTNPEQPGLASALDNLGIESSALGDDERAHGYHERARAIFEKTLGPDHPSLAISLVNLGNAAHRLGNPPEARRLHGRALAIFEKALGPEHPYVAHPLTALGEISLDQAEPAEALVPLERALTVRTTQQVDPTELAHTRFVLARALWDAPVERGRDRSRARGLAERAREVIASAEGTGGSGIGVEEIERWLAERPLGSPVAD